MPEFRYEIIDSGGRRVTVASEAKSREELLLQLSGKGQVLVRWLDEKRSSRAGFNRRREGLKPKALLQFTRDLAHLMKADLPMDRALTIVEASASEKAVAEMAAFLKGAIRGGSSLSDAMAEKRTTFSDLHVNMVRVGEMGGILPGVLAKLAQFMERTEEIKGFVIATAIYPAVLMGVGLVSILVIMGFVVPSFAGIFADLGQEVPFSTQVLLTLSELLRRWWWAFAATFAAASIALSRYAATGSGRKRLDRLLVQMPLVGPLVLEMQVSRFARTLGTLVNSGVPLLKALAIVSNVVTSSVVAEAVEHIHRKVRGGRMISRLMQEKEIFPPMVIQMTALGEETGRIGEMLEAAADELDRKSQARIKALLSLLEPAAILVMGLVIGFIVVSMLSTIFGINDIDF